MAPTSFSLRIGTLARLLFVAAAGLAVATASQAGNFRAGGTGSGLGIMMRLAEAYAKVDPSFRLDLVPNLGSSGGIKALSIGATHIAIASRRLKPDEAVAGLRAYEIGRTAFVLATRRPALKDLSIAQVVDLYAGRQTRWPDGQMVRLVLRPAGDGDTALLAAFSPAVKEALSTAMSREGMVTGLTDQDSVDEIERLPGAIGTASMVLLNTERRSAVPVAIDGVSPTLANVVSGRYSHVKPLVVVIREGAPAELIRFIAFAGSEAGLKVLAASDVDSSTSTAASVTKAAP